MKRSQLLAALVVIGVIGALVVARIQSGAETETNAATASDNANEIAQSDQDQDAQDSTPEDDVEGATQSDEQDGRPEVEPPPILDPKPALVDIDGWINTNASSLEDFDGQVRVVEFWTFGCFNCRNRISHTQELYAEFGDEGLEIIGVHAPEFDRERDPDAVAEATVDLGVTWPVALDTNKTNFRAWQEDRRFWPRVYVLDQNGDVRYDHIGEGDYDGLDEIVKYLIENGP